MNKPRQQRSSAHPCLPYTRSARACAWALTAAVGLSGSGLVGCDPAPLAFLPTPEPSAVTQADTRITVLGLSAPGVGRDLDGDQVSDNMLPVVLDSLLAAVEASVLLALEASSEDPEQVWALLETVLIGSGLPVSAEAYTQATEEATRTGSLCVLFQLNAPAGAPVSGRLGLGTLTSSGVRLDGVVLGELSGEGAPEALLRTDQLVYVPYPASWFTLPVWGGEAAFTWDSAGVHDAHLTGIIPLEALVNAYLTPIPETIEVGGVIVTIPKALIAANVADEMLHVTTEDGSPAVDQLWMGDPAVSAAWYLEGRPSLVQAE